MLGILICNTLNMLCVLQHLLPGQARSVVMTPLRGATQVNKCCAVVRKSRQETQGVSGVGIYNTSAATRVTNVEFYSFTVA